MAYNMLAFNNPNSWVGVGQNYNFGQALYQNWDRQLKDIMGYETMLQQWNAQRALDPMSQMAAASKLGLDVANNSAGITGVSDAFVGRQQALAARLRSAAPGGYGSTPIPQASLLAQFGVDQQVPQDPQTADPYSLFFGY